MVSLLRTWKGKIELNGVLYNSIEEVQKNVDLSKLNNTNVTIKLLKDGYIADTDKTQNKNKVEESSNTTQYVVTVKRWMTQKSSPSFDWMAKVNNDIPMPAMTMVGTILQETPKMIKMELKVDIYAPTVKTCMMCGKTLTNPISKYFGMGPECGGHNYTNPFSSDEELQAAVEEYRKVLNSKTWTGYIAKSAITEMKEVM